MRLNTPELLNVFVLVLNVIPDPIDERACVPLLLLVKRPAPSPEFLIPANNTLLVVAISCGKFSVIAPVEALAVIRFVVPAILNTPPLLNVPVLVLKDNPVPNNVFLNDPPELEDTKLLDNVLLVKLAVIVPAEKLPLESLATIADAVLVFVAVVAELETSPICVIVANFELLIPALEEISASTIKLLVRFPNALLCTTPEEENSLTDIVPADDTFSLSTPFVISDNAPDVAESPAFVEFVKLIAGVVVLPDINVKAPVIVPPLSGKFPLALPVTLPIRFAVIVPAEKLPVLSRATIADTVLRFVAVVAEFETRPAVVSVANLLLLIPALGEMSSSTIKLLDKTPKLFAWTTPVDNNPIFTWLSDNDNTFTPFDIKFSTLLTADNPVFVELVNNSDGLVEPPEGNDKLPLSAPPVNNKLPLAFPVKLAVIVPAENPPLESLNTTLETVLLDEPLMANCTSLRLFVMLIYWSDVSVLKFIIVPVVPWYIWPAPVPTLEPPALLGSENSTNSIISVPIRALGVLHTQALPL